MRLRQISPIASFILAAFLLQGGLPDISACAQNAAALSGQVSSGEEGAMEGVLVSARREGSTVTTTVVT
ncbi:MAG TPA: hypothetical protein VGH49_13805, partial [Xanthobacteraceae bacterium]